MNYCRYCMGPDDALTLYLCDLRAAQGELELRHGTLHLSLRMALGHAHLTNVTTGTIAWACDPHGRQRILQEVAEPLAAHQRWVQAMSQVYRARFRREQEAAL